MGFKKREQQTPKKTKINPREVAQKKRSLAETLTSSLEEQGVAFFTPVENNGNLNIDSNYLSLPPDLTTVDSRDLGNYLNAFTQQKAYMRTVCSWQEANLEESKRRYYEAYIQEYKELTEENPKMSEKAKELYCNNHAQVHDLYMEYRDYKEKVNMVAMTIESLTEFIFLVSREISRRGADWNEEQRTNNLR